MKKIVEGLSKESQPDGKIVMTFSEEEIELSLDEAVLAKELFSSIKQASPNEHEVILELQELFKE